MHCPASFPRLGIFVALIFLTAASASALIMVGRGNAPVTDNGWPAGSLDLANLKTRVGWWEGPPFGGGQHNFLYRGDVAAFQQALEALAEIKAPRVELFVHDGGPAHTTFLKDEKDPKSDDRYDWSFTVWNPESWHHLYNSPGSYFSAQDPNGGFGKDVDAPRIDVFVGNRGIDLARVKVPATVQVTDERADANGFADGSAIVGDAFDMTTSKPVAGAKVIIDSLDNTGKPALAFSGKADAGGHFVLRAIPSGNDRVWIAADGYAPRLLGYAGFHGNTFKRFTAQLAPLARVRGSVSDTDGKPIANATVRADSVIGPDGRGYISPQQITAQSDARGAFELNGLPQGHAQFFVSATSFALLDVLKLQSMPNDKIALRMTATGTVKVRVMNHEGKPASQGNVSIDAPGRALGSWGGSANTNADGTYTFDGVPPGTYIISAMATNPGPGPSPKDEKKTIKVVAGETIEVEIVGR
jgi:hypothetical protein